PDVHNRIGPFLCTSGAMLSHRVSPARFPVDTHHGRHWIRRDLVQIDNRYAAEESLMRVGSRTLCALCLALVAAHAADAQHSRREWKDYGGTPDNSRYLELDQIKKTNLDQLSAAWTYPTRDTIAYVFNPVIVDNVMYVLAKNNSLVALDATTGKELWIHEGLQGIAPRGINYWESKDRSD